MSCHLLAVAPLAGLQPRRVSISRRAFSLRAVAGRVFDFPAFWFASRAASRSARRAASRLSASALARGVSGVHSMSMYTSRRFSAPSPSFVSLAPFPFASKKPSDESGRGASSARSAPRSAPAARDWPSATSSSAGCSRITLPRRAASASETRHARIPSWRSSTSCRRAAHIASTAAAPSRLYESSSLANPNLSVPSSSSSSRSSPPNGEEDARIESSYRRRFRSHASTARLPARARTTDATAASLASVRAQPLRSTSRRRWLRRTPSTSAENEASPISESLNDTRRRL